MSSSMARSTSAPLYTRSRSRYISVLESALVGLGHEDALVQSTRKPRKKRRYDADDEFHSPVRGLSHALSAPEARSQAATQEEEEDPFVHLKLLKPYKKKKLGREEMIKGEEKRTAASPAVTRSAAKRNKWHKRCRGGVLEMVGGTPVTRSMAKKKWERNSLEVIQDTAQEEEEGEFVIQKTLSFQSPKKEKKVKVENKWKVQGEGRRANRKATLLRQWRVEWPPRLEAGSERAEMVLTGHVEQEAARFIVGKREGPVKFTSKDGAYVALSGKFDRDAARRAGMPRAAMELMKDGIPAFFYKRFLPYVQKSQPSDKLAAKLKPIKKASDGDRYSLPMPSIDEDLSTEESIALVEDVYETPKPAKIRVPVKKKTTRVQKDQPEPEEEADVWTNEQLEALMDAKLKIPTTASNFWAQVAQYIPGKSAHDCQAKTFEQFRSPPTNRKAAKAMKRPNAEANSAIPTKIARAGSNKFKKQVREFVEEYEKKHVDDLFDTTPSKEGLPELPEFDSIKSPELTTPLRSFDDDDSEMDDEAPGLLKKLSSRRRDDIDSYVLGINRQHVAGGGVMVGRKVRRVTSMATPVKASTAKTTSAKKKAVMLVEDAGSHFVRGVVSPGGTTHVRIEKDGSSSEGEGEADYYSSEEEEDFDIP